MNRNRRKQFLINKPLQFHYLFYVAALLIVVAGVGMTGTYFGIWSSVLKTFSEESLRETMTQAAQIQEYEQARHPRKIQNSLPTIRLFQETALLSERQKEVLRQIMDETQRKILGLGIFLLIFIAWGSIFLTHKIAGPISKLNQHFRMLERGDLTARIRFRKFDEIRDSAGEFNKMTAALDVRIGTLKRLARETKSERITTELGQFKTTVD